MIQYLGTVVGSLWGFMAAVEGGWIGTFTLYDDINEGYSFPGYSIDDLIEALERLKAMELVEQDSAASDYWRISMKFYNDLPEWGAQVIKTLVDYPGWHSQEEVTRLVAATRFVIIEPAMRETIMAYLKKESKDVVEFLYDNYVRIRFSEWLKRCQTPAHSL